MFMNRKSALCFSVLCFFICFLLALSGLRARDAALASDLAPKILRFHVLANSDSAADQALKLRVKDLLLGEIRSATDGMGELNKEVLKTYIESNSSTLELSAEDFIHSQGYDYGVKVGIETCEFPVRTYGDMTFPAGMYEAVRVVIGNGAGHNFWCVLYPSLCYTDSVHASMPEESKETLKNLIPEDDFQALLNFRTTAVFSHRDPAASSDTKSNEAKSAATQTNEKSEQETISLPTVKIRFRIAGLLSGR